MDTQYHVSDVNKTAYVVDRCVEIKIQSNCYSYNRIISCRVVDEILN